MRLFTLLLMSLFLLTFTACSNSAKNDQEDHSLSVNGEMDNQQPVVNVTPTPALLEESNMGSDSDKNSDNGLVMDYNNAKEIHMTMQDLLFKFNSVTINPKGKKILKKVIKLMSSYPHSVIYLDGHSDNIGPSSAKHRIALGRAKNVAKFIIAHSIPASRVHVKGWSDKKPLVPNTSKKNRQKNRRVEIKIKKNQ